MNSAVLNFSRLVVLPHSVFALPFALSALLLAARALNHQVVIPNITWIWVILAVISARTAAMAFNRLIDASIDAKNSRTHLRELPSGKMSKQSVVLIIWLSSLLFLLFSAFLGKHCLKLAPFVLLVLFGYSYAKRYTRYSHFVLGLALSLAPGGAWWVLYPTVSFTPLVLMASVMLWVAGFDILYSVQDIDFDRSNSLHSIPAWLGIKRSLHISTLLHILTLIGFLLVGWSANLAPLYYYGIAALSIFLIGQHFLITPQDLSRINHAFFTFNGYTSLGYFVLVMLCA